MPRSSHFICKSRELDLEAESQNYRAVELRKDHWRLPPAFSKLSQLEQNAYDCGQILSFSKHQEFVAFLLEDVQGVQLPLQ